MSYEVEVYEAGDKWGILEGCYFWNYCDCDCDYLFVVISGADPIPDPYFFFDSYKSLCNVYI